MTKRSLIIAAALFSGFVLPAPTYAGSTLITTLGTALSVNAGGSVNELKVTYTDPIDPGSFTLLPSSTISGVSDTISGNVVTVMFSPVVPTFLSPAHIDFTVTTGSGTPPPDITFNTFAFSGANLKSAFGGVSVSAAAVPEPSSMMLVGIGVAGCLSFRRFLSRRKAVV